MAKNTVWHTWVVRYSWPPLALAGSLAPTWKNLKQLLPCTRAVLLTILTSPPSKPPSKSKMATSKLYAFAADGEVYPCQNPKNTPLCQALLDKSETYGHTGRDYYKRQNYIEAAETVTVLGHTLAAVNFADSTEVVDKISGYFGPRVGAFVLEWCKENPPCPPSAPSIAQIMRHHHTPKLKCAHADNEPVYAAVMARARSYPPEKKYNRQAYLNAAAALAAHSTSLKVKPHSAWEINGTGPSTMRFIRNAADDIFGWGWGFP